MKLWSVFLYFYRVSFPFYHFFSFAPLLLSAHLCSLPPSAPSEKQNFFSPTEKHTLNFSLSSSMNCIKRNGPEQLTQNLPPKISLKNRALRKKPEKTSSGSEKSKLNIWPMISGNNLELSQTLEQALCRLLHLLYHSSSFQKLQLKPLCKS